MFKPEELKFEKDQGQKGPPEKVEKPKEKSTKKDLTQNLAEILEKVPEATKEKEYKEKEKTIAEREEILEEVGQKEKELEEKIEEKTKEKIKEIVKEEKKPEEEPIKEVGIEKGNRENKKIIGRVRLNQEEFDEFIEREKLKNVKEKIEKITDNSGQEIEKRIILEKDKKKNKEKKLDYLLPLEDPGEFFQKEDIPYFDPEEELKKIHSELKNLPLEKQSEIREIRHEKIKNFKEKLVFQKIGIAKTAAYLEDFIHKDPDTSFKELFKIVKENRKKYALNDKQVDIFKTSIGGYRKKHLIIEKYEKKHKNTSTKEFFKDIFGFYPKGKIELIVKPITFYWKCFNFEDFCQASGFPPKEAKKVAGYKLGFSKIPELNGLINIENSSISDFLKDKNYSKKVQLHEEQHSIEEIFKGGDLEFQKNKIDVKKVKFNIPAIEKIKADIYDLYDLYDPCIKNEILAHLKEESRNFKKIEVILTKKGGGYDFIKKTDFKNLYLRLLEKEIKKIYVSEKDKKMLKEIIQKMFNNTLKQIEKEYPQKISSFIRAAKNLSKFLPKREELVWLLSIEPIKKWSRLARFFQEVIDRGLTSGNSRGQTSERFFN